MESTEGAATLSFRFFFAVIFGSARLLQNKLVLCDVPVRHTPKLVSLLDSGVGGGRGQQEEEEEEEDEEVLLQDAPGGLRVGQCPAVHTAITSKCTVGGAAAATPAAAAAAAAAAAEK